MDLDWHKNRPLLSLPREKKCYGPISKFAISDDLGNADGPMTNYHKYKLAPDVTGECAPRGRSSPRRRFVVRSTR